MSLLSRLHASFHAVRWIDGAFDDVFINSGGSWCGLTQDLLPIRP